MRILNRPMFRYGGPIKEGIMHGMRNGGRAAALVGNPIFPKDSSGRAHHVWQFAVPAVRALAGFAMGQGGKKLGQKAIQEGIKKGTTTAAANPGFWKSIYQQDPMVRSSKWLWNALRSPKAKSWGESAVKGLLSPTSLALSGGATWMFWPDGTPKTKEEIAATGGKPGEKWSPGVGGEQYDPSTSPSALAAKAKAARKAKLEKYLDTMGYDKAKKTAMGDALIDASAIVQQGTEEAGSLKHADWGKMINQAIQTTSKRLDKPDQIREAVGLMLTKSEIQKDLEDPEAKKLRRMQIKKIEDELEGNSFAENKILTAKNAPGQSGYDLAVEITKGKDFKGNLVDSTEWLKSLEKMKDDDDFAGQNEKQLIKGYTEKLIAGKNYEDGHYTVGDNLVTIKDSLVIDVE